MNTIASCAYLVRNKQESNTWYSIISLRIRSMETEWEPNACTCIPSFCTAWNLSSIWFVMNRHVDPTRSSFSCVLFFHSFQHFNTTCSAARAVHSIDRNTTPTIASNAQETQPLQQWYGTLNRIGIGSDPFIATQSRNMMQSEFLPCHSCRLSSIMRSGLHVYVMMRMMTQLLACCAFALWCRML